MPPTVFCGRGNEGTTGILLDAQSGIQSPTKSESQGYPQMQEEENHTLKPLSGVSGALPHSPWRGSPPPRTSSLVQKIFYFQIPGLGWPPLRVSVQDPAHTHMHTHRHMGTHLPLRGIFECTHCTRQSTPISPSGSHHPTECHSPVTSSPVLLVGGGTDTESQQMGLFSPIFSPIVCFYCTKKPRHLNLCPLSAPTTLFLVPCPIISSCFLIFG